MLLEQTIADTSNSSRLRMLTTEQVAFYHEHGYLRIPQMFTQSETDGMGALK
jgi:hypothetical protein